MRDIEDQRRDWFILNGLFSLLPFFLMVSLIRMAAGDDINRGVRAGADYYYTFLASQMQRLPLPERARIMAGQVKVAGNSKDNLLMTRAGLQTHAPSRPV